MAIGYWQQQGEPVVYTIESLIRPANIAFRLDLYGESPTHGVDVPSFGTFSVPLGYSEPSWDTSTGVNGHPSLSFDAANNESLRSAIAADLTEKDYTLVVVHSKEPNSGGQQIAARLAYDLGGPAEERTGVGSSSFSLDDLQYGYLGHRNSASPNANVSTGVTFSSSALTLASAWQVSHELGTVAFWSRSLGPPDELQQSSSVIGIGNYADATDAYFTSQPDLYLGGGTTGSEVSRVGEVIVIDRSMTDWEVALLLSLLNDKWGV